MVLCTISSRIPGVCAPPPTTKIALGGLFPLSSLIFSPMVLPTSATIGRITSLSFAELLEHSNPNISINFISSSVFICLFIISAVLKSTKHSFAITSVTSSPAIGTIPYATIL